MSEPIDDKETQELGRAELGRVEAPRVFVTVYAGDQAETVPLRDRRPLVIGRRPPADITLADASLSRRHARFELRDGQVWVEDLGSKNGTFVNGERLEGARPVSGLDEIKLGSVPVAVQRQGGHPDERALDRYDEFLRLVTFDVARCRALGRSGAMIFLCATEPVDGWLGGVRGVMRSFDRLGGYGPRELLMWMPEAELEAAEAQARRVIGAATTPDLRAGIAIFGRAAATADELVAASLEAGYAATRAQPVSTAGAGSRGPSAVAPEAPVIESAAMKRLYELAARVGRSELPILITGETGTGKEVLAQHLHEVSGRPGPLRSINCGAIPAQLLESELFGHEKGAFTGADSQRAGLFEEASGGTVFLDEVGELPANAQVALLRVLEERKVRRVGSAVEIDVDVRVLAATHRDLEAGVRDGDFREDLLYRLNTVTLEVPPLRERVEEIGPLAERFRRSTRAGDLVLSAKRVGPDAVKALRAYPWPGNVRELRNVIQRAAIICTTEAIEAADLPPKVREPAGAGPELPTSGDFKQRMQTLERSVLSEVLEDCGWNVKEASRRLDIPYRTLTGRLRALGLKRPGR